MATIFALRSYLVTRSIEADAGSDWDYRVRENMQDKTLTKEQYVRAYTKVNKPRISKYLAAAFATIFVLTIPAFSLVQGFLYMVWRYTRDQSRVYEPTYLVHNISIYFSVMGLWAVIIGLYTRLYHKRSPGLMRDEILRMREGKEQ